jgi:ABC-type transport system involved in multi-copper enzyme maturation permease subunit
MASTGSNLTLGTRIMPFLALLRHDLRALAGSWLVRIWLAASALLALLWISSNWAQLQTAPLIASLLFPYLIAPWFLVVMVLGVTPITGSRVEALADGFLSRPVTRHEYLLAVWASRVAVVLGCYLLVVVPAVALVALANRPVAADRVTLYGIVGSLGVVGLVLTLQVSLAFLFGILLRKPLLAIVVLLFLWYPVNTVLDTFKLESISPITLTKAIPTLVREPCNAVDASDNDFLSDQDAKAIRDAANFLTVLSGTAPKKAPDRKTPFFEEKFENVSLGRVVLGYGIPTLLSLCLATFCFCVRDL